MNEQSPLVPQGSFESQAKRKSHVRIAVFGILAIHVVVLGAFLIIGCKPESKENASNNTITPTNDLAATAPFTPSNEVAVLPPVPPPATSNNIVVPSPLVPGPLPPVPPATVTEHKVAKGDYFDTLAKRYGVTTKAIQDANPTLVPTKLQIGDIVKIPAKTPAVVRAPVTPTPVAVPADSYKVKSGDNLTTIAKNNHTTVKEIQRLNSLKTTQIKVAQILKMPASHPTPGPTAGTTPAPAITPTGTPVPAGL